MHAPSISRYGLATLELVLAVPLLMMIMALMINYSTAACWKVRTSVMARHAVWASRAGHLGDSIPQPTWWPASGVVSSDTPGLVSNLDDPRLRKRVVRGPLSSGTVVNEDLFNPSKGLHTSKATLARSFPMLGKLGTYHLQANSALLDGVWTYTQMGMTSNEERRIPILYTLAKASDNFSRAYIQAVQTILHSTVLQLLKPLDEDDEFTAYGMLLGWSDIPPDFHPQLNGFCQLDREMADDRVLDLVNRIQGKIDRDENGNITQRIPDVAETMTTAFIHLYEQTIAAGKTGDFAVTSGTILDLQAKLTTLQQFLLALTGNLGT